VLNIIRGEDVTTAREILADTSREAADVIGKVLASAIANAVTNDGMNADELSANERLDRWFIQDLNEDWILPLDSESLDAVLCCVGMQYLQHPIEVATEVRRVLKPGGRFLVSFSNRCFWTKAVEIWRKLSDHGHNNLVRWYLERAGFAEIESFVPSDGSQGDPMLVVSGRA